jgi:transmembrane sensor
MRASPISRLRRPWNPEPASEAAAAWVLRQEEGELSDADQQRFADWLAEDESHVAAYEDALWALDAAARHAGDPEIQRLRRDALMARGNRRQLWGWVGGVGVSAAAVLAAVTFFAAPIGQAPPVGVATPMAEKSADPRLSTYQTGIGQRSAISLPDGSVATLDTDSQIRVAYSDKERGVYLLKGQALFEVAHGKPVPFQVYAKGQRITAVGTVFNVRIEGDEVRVSMVEGTVKVRPIPPPTGDGAAPVREITLTAGEAIVAAPAKPLIVTPVAVRDVAAWKGGELVFNDVPLSDAVAEINRYTTHPIAIADGAVGNYRVSGVFQSNDPEHFSQAMAEVFPIQVTHAADGAPILRARAD